MNWSSQRVLVAVVQGLVTWWRRRARAQGVVGGGLVIVVTLRVAIYSACVLLVSPHDSDRR